MFGRGCPRPTITWIYGIPPNEFHLHAPFARGAASISAMSTTAPDYLAPYEEAVQRFGASFEATLWASKSAQVKRFGVMAEMVDLHGRVIVDAGAALGDFAVFLEEHDIAYERYIGLDAMAGVIEEAGKRGVPRAKFAVSDFVARPEDYVTHALPGEPEVITFSGSLNTLEMEAARAAVGDAFDRVTHAVVFNFLSTHFVHAHRVQTGPARRFDPLKMLDWALKRTPDVRFRQDYLDGHDATIAMFK